MPKTIPNFGAYFYRCLDHFGLPKRRVFRGGDLPFLYKIRFSTPSGRFWPHLGLLVPMLVPFWSFWDPFLEIPDSCLVSFWGPVGDLGSAFSTRPRAPRRNQQRTPHKPRLGSETDSATISVFVGVDIGTVLVSFCDRHGGGISAAAQLDPRGALGARKARVSAPYRTLT